MEFSTIIPNWAHLLAEGIGWASMTGLIGFAAIIIHDMWADWRGEQRQKRGDN